MAQPDPEKDKKPKHRISLWEILFIGYFVIMVRFLEGVLDVSAMYWIRTAYAMIYFLTVFTVAFFIWLSLVSFRKWAYWQASATVLATVVVIAIIENFFIRDWARSILP